MVSRVRVHLAAALADAVVVKDVLAVEREVSVIAIHAPVVDLALQTRNRQERWHQQR